MLEYEKFQELQAKSQKMQEDYERQLQEMEENRERALEELNEYYETKLQEMTAKLEQVTISTDLFMISGKSCFANGKYNKTFLIHHLH